MTDVSGTEATKSGVAVTGATAVTATAAATTATGKLKSEVLDVEEDTEASSKLQQGQSGSARSGRDTAPVHALSTPVAALRVLVAGGEAMFTASNIDSRALTFRTLQNIRTGLIQDGETAASYNRMVVHDTSHLPLYLVMSVEHIPPVQQRAGDQPPLYQPPARAYTHYPTLLAHATAARIVAMRAKETVHAVIDIDEVQRKLNDQATTHRWSYYMKVGRKPARQFGSPDTIVTYKDPESQQWLAEVMEDSRFFLMAILNYNLKRLTDTEFEKEPTRPIGLTDAVRYELLPFHRSHAKLSVDKQEQPKFAWVHNDQAKSLLDDFNVQDSQLYNLRQDWSKLQDLINPFKDVQVTTVLAKLHGKLMPEVAATGVRTYARRIPKIGEVWEGGVMIHVHVLGYALDANNKPVRGKPIHLDVVIGAQGHLSQLYDAIRTGHVNPNQVALSLKLRMLYSTQSGTLDAAESDTLPSTDRLARVKNNDINKLHQLGIQHDSVLYLLVAKEQDGHRIFVHM